MYQYQQVLLRMRQGDSDHETARSGLMGRRCRRLCGRSRWLATGWIRPGHCPTPRLWLRSLPTKHGRRRCNDAAALGRTVRALDRANDDATITAGD